MTHGGDKKLMKNKLIVELDDDNYVTFRGITLAKSSRFVWQSERRSAASASDTV